MTFEEEIQTTPFEKTYRVFLYQHIQHAWYSIFEQNGSEPPVMDNYVRLSEGLDVKFVQLGSDEGIQAAMQALDKAEQQARMELAKKLSEINDRRAGLLALTHSPDNQW